MPNDPYQIGEDNSGITLVLSDRGVGTPSVHGNSTHLTGGSDAIQLATASQVGLMSAAFATKLTNIEELADVTDAGNIASSIAGTTAAAAADGDFFPFLDVSTSSALKKTTLANLRSDYLNTYYVTPTGTQTLSNKTLTAPTINGGSLTGTAISLTDAALTGILPVAKGGTGVTAKTGTGNVVLSDSPTLVTPALGTPTQGSLVSCLNLPIVGGTIGTLSVARGGTGATTLTGVLKGSGTANITAGPVALTAEVTGVLPLANGGTGASTLSSGVIKSNGTVLSSSAVGLTTEVTGVLPIANGGTGFSTNPFGQLSSQMAASPVASFTTFAKLAMDTDFDSTNSSGFDDGGVDNRLHYTGATTRRFLVFASTDILDSAAGSNYSIMLYKNGTTALLETECRANTAGKGSAFLAKLVTSWIVSLSQNDFVELFVASTTGDGGTPQRMRLIATPV
jgi:hypothetical protein